MNTRLWLPVFFLIAGVPVCEITSVRAQTLEAELQRMDLKELAAKSREIGDAARGAVVFHQAQLACSKCHIVGNSTTEASLSLLGPDLTTLDKATTDESIVEAVLFPSKVIRKGFESVSIVTADGAAISALLVEQTKEKIVVRDVSRAGQQVTFAMQDVEAVKLNELSIMPAGQVNQLNSRQQFFDLIRYLIEIRDGGKSRALQLQPSASLLTFTVPEYESHLDHRGLISGWNDEALKRGEAIYQRVCANCHGTKDQPGSLPTSLRFAEGKFKNGSDPLSMYRTLTHGFGLMVPQTWMVPSQKYDVVHYIREAYLKTHNPSQYTALDAEYLDRLPRGDTLGPEPSNIEVWSAMDYGSSLTHTFEVPGSKHNLAYKGIAIRLDPGAGGVSRGRHWMIFDTDTLRTAVGWSAGDASASSSGQGTGQFTRQGSGDKSNFIDWRGIQFNGEHGIHPRIVGKADFVNSTGPGWANPTTGQFLDDQRVEGRDGRRYGPLPRSWGRFKGLYHHDQQVILSYSIGTTDILELPRILTGDGDAASPTMLRTFNVGPREQDLILQVAEHAASDVRLSFVNSGSSSLNTTANSTLSSTVNSAKDLSVAKLSLPEPEDVAPSLNKLSFDGSTFLQTKDLTAFDIFEQDFSVVAKIKTKTDGTIWSASEGGEKWNPDGQSLFLRDGKLAYDIGWVGAVSGKANVADDRWHTVAITWSHSDKKVRLYVDGKLDGEGRLAAKRAMPSGVMRIGFTSSNFPGPENQFKGEISRLRFYQRQLLDGLTDIKSLPTDSSLVADWELHNVVGSTVFDSTNNKNHVAVRHDGEAVRTSTDPILAGFVPRSLDAQWSEKDGSLRLRIPAGKSPLRFTVWLPAATNVDSTADDTQAKVVNEKLFKEPLITDAELDLTALTRGGVRRWPQILTTQVAKGDDNGPFAVDVLTAPEANPWLAQIRLTGLDFFGDGRIAVCSWDGDVWIITPATSSDDRTLSWQRVASGLYQPLGLKILNGKMHLICRDQLVVLHDLNADGEIDFYECLNNDHQVTEHFHEFAMGLQTDAAGNFYYAKSGCHGKAAVVPHHGTLLRISPDGSHTEILANGFRAANGVCLNPDGSFVVTDQEGFWNPKNRINWVTLSDSGKPNFYGNMLGYHDVTDTSDSAMVPPLCWITNAFDRSPAELLWVDSDRWGPLKGSLLNLSYGYGKVYLVPHERVNGLMQGGMIELPMPVFPTGVMRGRFHPDDGQLYLCGMFAWAGNATQPGGLYRLRATGQALNLPIGLHAAKSGLSLTFTEAIDPSSLDLNQVSIKTWSLQRTANYGSKHYDEKFLRVRDLKISTNGKSVTFDIQDLCPTWCMEIKYAFRSSSGLAVQGTIHNTIHELDE